MLSQFARRDLLRLVDGWNRERNGCSQSRSVTLGPDPASVRLDDPLTDRKAQAGVASLVFGIDPRKFPEQARQTRGRDALALVGD